MKQLSFKIFLALATALLVSTAFWHPSLWPLALVGFLPLFYAMERSGKGLALAIALAAVVSMELLIWSPLFSVRAIGAVPLPTVFLIVAGTALFVAALAAAGGVLLWLAFRFLPRLARPLAIPLAWALWERGVSFVIVGLEWAYLGEIFVESPLRIFAGWGGLPLLTIFLVAMNVLAYEALRFAFRRWSRRASDRIRAVGPLLGIAGGLVMLLFLAHAMIGEVSAPPATGAKVVVVQPGYNQIDKRQFEIINDLLRSASLRPGEIVIVGGRVFNEPFTSATLTPTAIQEAFPGILGEGRKAVVSLLYREREEVYDAVVALNAENILGISRKRWLFPFSDYTPRFLRRFVDVTHIHHHVSYEGDNVPVDLISPAMPVGLVRCSENFVPDPWRELSGAGARLFITTGGGLPAFRDQKRIAEEMLRASRFRAIENGAFVIQANKTGISAIIDPAGRVLASLPEGTSGILRFEF